MGAVKQLPEHVQKMARGGMMCMHCGGSVDRDGYAEGGEVGESDGGIYEEQMRRREETRRQEGRADAGQDMSELAGAKPRKGGYKVRAYAHGGEVDDDEGEEESRYGEQQEDDEEKEEQKHALFLMALRRRR